MKLIFINRFFHPDHSATSQMLSDLAFYLAGQGREVQVITSRLRYDKPGVVLSAREDVQGVGVHRVWTSRFGRHFLPGRAVDYLTFYLSAAWRLFWLAGRGDVVIAKTDPPMISLIARPVARLRGARQVNWLQDLFPEVAVALKVRGFGGRFGRFLVAMRNRSLAAPAVSVVLGERMRDRLLAEGLADSNLRIIHNWANGKSIQPAAVQTNPLRQDWALEDKFVVAYSGNLGRAHAFDTVLQAARGLEGHAAIRFLFIGGGSQFACLQKEAERIGLSNIRFECYQSRDRLKHSLTLPDVHIVILRPEMEGLIVPSKIYGILASGRASIFIGDRDGEVARILGGADAGVSSAIDDPDELQGHILALYADAERLKQMGENARKAFDVHYSCTRAFSQWEDVLREAAAEQAGAGS